MDRVRALQAFSRYARLSASVTLILRLSITPLYAQSASSDGEWRMPAHDYASTRYSDLAEITGANVSRLTVQFTFSTGVARGQESAPLVVGNTMYIVAPYPNELFALDLTQPGAPLKWSYKPKPLAAAQGVACCDVVNRRSAVRGMQ